MKTGSQVLGTPVDLLDIGGTLYICKRDAQHILERKLGITDRQARAAVSSYQAEKWTEADEGFLRLNDPLCQVNSFESRVLEHADRRYDARVENGRKGGRPRKPSAA